MKRQQFLFLVFSIFLSNMTFGQIENADNFKLNCDSIKLVDYEIIYIDNMSVAYKVLSRGNTVYYLKDIDRFLIQGEVLIPDLDIRMESSIVDNIFQLIGTKHGIDKLKGFRTCEAIRIFYQAMMPLPGQEAHLKENFFGIFNIDQ